MQALFGMHPSRFAAGWGREKGRRSEIIEEAFDLNRELQRVASAQDASSTLRTTREQSSDYWGQASTTRQVAEWRRATSDEMAKRRCA